MQWCTRSCATLSENPRVVLSLRGAAGRPGVFLNPYVVLQRGGRPNSRRATMAWGAARPADEGPTCPRTPISRRPKGPRLSRGATPSSAIGGGRPLGGGPRAEGCASLSGGRWSIASCSTWDLVLSPCSTATKVAADHHRVGHHAAEPRPSSSSRAELAEQRGGTNSMRRLSARRSRPATSMVAAGPVPGPPARRRVPRGDGGGHRTASAALARARGRDGWRRRGG